MGQRFGRCVVGKNADGQARLQADGEGAGVEPGRKAEDEAGRSCAVHRSQGQG